MKVWLELDRTRQVSILTPEEACGASCNPGPGPRQTAGPQLHWAPKSTAAAASQGGEGLEGSPLYKELGRRATRQVHPAAVALRDLTGAWVLVGMGG